MFLKVSNLMFLFFLLNSTILVFSSSSWVMSWICLEINLMALTPLLIYKLKFTNASSTIKYFLVQAMASLFLFLGILLLLVKNYHMSNSNNIDLINLALAMKLGMPPFQFWLPQVIEMINFVKMILILLWQKIAPITIMSYSPTNMVIMMTLTSAMVGAVGGMNQNNLKKILFYSSLVHLSWMMMGMVTNEKIWVAYFFLYSLMLIPLMIMLYMNKINKMTKIMMMTENKTTKLFIVMMMLVLAGLPPFIGFFNKMMIVMMIMSSSWSLFSSIILIMASLISIFFYFKMTWNALMMNNTMKKSMMFMTQKKNSVMNLILMMTMLAPFMVMLT